MGVLKVGVFPRVDNYWITEGSMLALFRKKQGGLKWVLWLVIFALGFGMVLFFVDAPTVSSTGFSSQEAAVVAGATITASEFRTRYLQVIEQYRKLYNLDQQDPKVIQQLRLGDTALERAHRRICCGVWCRATGAPRNRHRNRRFHHSAAGLPRKREIHWTGSLRENYTGQQPDDSAVRGGDSAPHRARQTTAYSHRWHFQFAR